jgi:predicted AAA+ superfamily ATPase
MLTFKDLPGRVIMDEVQRKPELFQLLRVLVDRLGQNTRFFIVGFDLAAFSQGVSEPLAGRIGFVDLVGF